MQHKSISDTTKLTRHDRHRCMQALVTQELHAAPMALQTQVHASIRYTGIACSTNGTADTGACKPKLHRNSMQHAAPMALQIQVHASRSYTEIAYSTNGTAGTGASKHKSHRNCMQHQWHCRYRCKQALVTQELHAAPMALQIQVHASIGYTGIAFSTNGPADTGACKHKLHRNSMLHAAPMALQVQVYAASRRSAKQ
jgi:hypothetical protein